MPRDPYIGELALYPYVFVPYNWALCDGRLLPIAKNSELWSLLGTTYGGDGKTTFALPDLRSRAAIGYGQGKGLSQISLGEQGGSTSVSLTTSQMPSHGHRMHVAEHHDADSPSPAGKILAVGVDMDGERVDLYGIPDGTPMPQQTVVAAGSSAPIDTRSPYLGLEWCIALKGDMPPRE